MRFSRFLLLLASMLLSLASCAFVPHQATLKPVVECTQIDVGKGVAVAVSVIDERPDQVLGHRGAAYGKAAKITTDQVVADVILASIVDGLKKKGFQINQSQSDLPRKLKVEIRLIEYSTSIGFWTGGIHTKATLKAIANNNGKIYENLYRVERENRVIVVPTAEQNEEWINAAISEVINKLLEDTSLTAHLAG